jgi:hypothetical protein
LIVHSPGKEWRAGLSVSLRLGSYSEIFRRNGQTRSDF